ncbi:hypothetical protein [Streptacidiphilus carbonis]|uniref:hypothetical protein n=1 Tax=Streptacidiphilus carbonis TaxID=105422 RepID=UPI0005A66EEE|nr:hypothetical protein [Streptacidiphilus carbonis]
MHAEELSKSAISAEVATDIAARLTAVRARIAEIEEQLPALRETEAWLQGVLAAVGEKPGDQPVTASASAPVAVAVEGEAVAEPAVAVPAPRRETKPAKTAKTAKAAKPARAAKPAKEPKAPRTPRASRRKPAAEGSTTAGSAPSLPTRVLALLSTKRDPQKTSEIAQELFGTEATTVQTNLARGAAEALVKRGQAEKAKQGSTVFYQAAGTADEAAGAVVASND